MNDLTDMGMVKLMVAGTQFGKMDVIQSELCPVLCRKCPACLYHVRARIHARGRKRRPKGTPLVRIKIDHGVVGIKNQIFVLLGFFLHGLPLHNTAPRSAYLFYPAVCGMLCFVRSICPLISNSAR